MAGILETFKSKTPEAIPVSRGTLLSFAAHNPEAFQELTRLTPEQAKLKMIMGELPLVSPHDTKLFPPDTSLKKVPEKLKSEIDTAETGDIAKWNSPRIFLDRLRATKFQAPNHEMQSGVMQDLENSGKVVSFDDLRISSPTPEGKQRVSRSNEAYPGLLSISIMGNGRMPLMLGAVPDVASRESYRKAAMSGVMVTASRDKIWADPKNQATLIGSVINDLKTIPLSEGMIPTIDELREFWKIKQYSDGSFHENVALTQYEQELRNYWISNIGVAIEASPKGVDRAKLLHEVGCNMFRIYSPEGGHEIVETVNGLRNVTEFEKGKVNIIAGQIMDKDTARAAVTAGCDAVIIGVAGGSQCTTSINADIPVNTPNLLNQLRTENLGVPIGIEGGGVGTHMMTALALGASFFSKPGEIGVSLSGTGDYVFEDPREKWYVLYGGEASNSAKMWRPDSFDLQGRIRFPEGEGGIRILSENNGTFDADNLDDRKSLVRNIERLIFAMSVGLVFQRVKTVEEMHKKGPVNVVHVSQNASELSHPYAR